MRRLAACRIVQRAGTSYNPKLLYMWDKFPVNDGKRARLFLNPLTGRAPDLYKYIEGITSNPMIEPYASMPALANYGDYTWNGPAYDPTASMAEVLDELAGPDPAVRTALRTFADLNQNWPYRASTQNAPELTKDITSFWSGRADGSTAGTAALSARLAEIVALPASSRVTCPSRSRNAVSPSRRCARYIRSSPPKSHSTGRSRAPTTRFSANAETPA